MSSSDGGHLTQSPREQRGEKPSTLRDGVAPLRGAAPNPTRARIWIVAAFACLLLLAVAVAASFVSASRDNARVERLKAQGIAVNVTVSDCRGNLGGSGSNSVDYTCHGDYRLGATTYHEVIGAMTTFSSAGSVVRGVVDPSQHGYVTLASALEHTTPSSSAYVVPGLLAIALLALTFALWRVTRRHR